MEEVGKRLYTMREACSLLGVHPNTLRRWDRKGKIQVVRPERGQRRIPESEIIRLQANQPISPPVSPPPQQTISQQEHFSSFLSYVFSYHRDDWELVKRAILIRDNYTCSRCGGKELLAVHHKDGTGRNDPENLVTLCQKCHNEIHENLSKQKTREIEPKAHEKPQERPKIETKPAITPSETEEIPRQTVLDELAPAGIAQRTAFGDLLSSATALRIFTLEELAARARCPAAIVKVFCDRMGDRGYLLSKEGRYELRVKVGR